MATDYAKYKGYNYIRIGGINQNLVDKLLAGLELALPQGVRLEDPEREGKFEFLPLTDAAELVLTWSIDNAELSTRDQTALTKLIKGKSYSLFAQALQVDLETRTHDPNKLVTSALVQNVAALESVQQAAARAATNLPPGHYDPARAIINYNRLRAHLTHLIASGHPAQLAAALVPRELTAMYGGSFTGTVLAGLIADELTNLYPLATTLGPELSGSQIAQRLARQIVETRPDLVGYLNLLGDPATQTGLRNLVENVGQSYLRAGHSLADLEQAKFAAARGLDDWIPTQYDLSRIIVSSIPSLPADQAQALSTAILTSLTTHYGTALSAEELVRSAAKSLNYSGDLGYVLTQLHASHLDTALEYRQHELVIKVRGTRLTRGEINLLKQGINPFLTLEKTPPKFYAERDSFLALYNQTYQAQNPGSPPLTLEQASRHAATLPSPDWGTIRQFRSLLDRQAAYQNLSPQQLSLLKRTRFGRWVEEVRGKSSANRYKLADRLFDLEDTLTGRKFLRKMFDRWDTFTQTKAILALKNPFSGKVVKIPLFRLLPWVFSSWDAYKYRTPIKWLKRLRGTKTGSGRLAQWFFRNYAKGHNTLGGLFYSARSEAWGWTTKKLFALSAKYFSKHATSGVFKYAARSLGRTALRFLIKIGGKALAKFGTKAIAALLAAGTMIGTIFSALMMVGMVFDILKLGYDFIKELIVNADFRGKMAKIGLAVSGVFLALQSIPFLAILGIIVGSIIGPLLLAGAIALIAVASYTFLFNSSNTTMRLDPGVAYTMISNLICDEGEVGDPCANQAVCLAKYLTECYGPSVTASDFSGGGSNSLQCLLAKGVDAATGNYIYHSATGIEDNDNLQCVGFAQAAQNMCGRTLEPKNACSYVGGASGYTFVSGLSGIKPGNPVVIGSSDCSDGSPGHIAIYLGDAGALITVADANQVCPGCVKADNKLPKDKITGYLH